MIRQNAKEFCKKSTMYLTKPTELINKGETMSTVTYQIPAINCGHCVKTIKDELSELEGVQRVEGDPTEKTIQVVFDSPATEDSIKALLKEINYPVQ
jgi:copper chaperone CopZ